MSQCLATLCVAYLSWFLVAVFLWGAYSAWGYGDIVPGMGMVALVPPAVFMAITFTRDAIADWRNR